MQYALNLAANAEVLGEVPVGAVLVRDGEVIGEGFNQPLSSHDPTAHAEVVALRDAAQREQNYRLPSTTLYVTVEPCTMCCGALVHARVERVVFGCREPRAGAAVSQSSLLSAPYLNHRIEVDEGVCEKECSQMMKDFFQQRR